MSIAAGAGRQNQGAERREGATAHAVAAPSWGWILACALVMMGLGAAAVILPLSQHRPLAESAGWILLIGGAVEALLGTTCARSRLGQAALLSGGLARSWGLSSY